MAEVESTDKALPADGELEILLEQPPAPSMGRWGRRATHAVVLALALAALAAAAASARPGSPGRPQRTAGADVRAAVALADAGAAAEAAGDRRARAIERVLNQKPKHELSGIVEKAVHHAAKHAVAKHAIEKREEEARSHREDQIQRERKAICAFDVIDSVQSVARIGLVIQAAARTCPNAKGLAEKVCALNAVVVVSSISNLALHISTAVSACAETTKTKNAKALCASATEALVVGLSTMGAGGILTAETCRPGLDASRLGLPPGATAADLNGPPPQLLPAVPARRLFLGGGRNNALGQCVLDWTEVAWSLGSVGLAITTAARDVCPDHVRGMGKLRKVSRAACAMDISNVIYAFGRIALFIALSAVHCTNSLNLQALCGAGVSALVSAAAGLAVSGSAFYVACHAGVHEGQRLPSRVVAASEAGLTRRLGAQATAEGAGSSSIRDMERLVAVYGYNVTDPLRLPAFESVDSALRALESFSNLQAEELGVGRHTLGKNFSSVEGIWSSLGFDPEDAEGVALPAEPQDRSERFVRLMEPALSDEDLAQVDAAARQPPSE